MSGMHPDGVGPEPVSTVIPSPPVTDTSAPAGTGLQPVGGRYITLLVLGMFGSFMATVAAMSYALAVRVEQITPGVPGNLGYVVGIGAAVLVLLGPFFGVLSDRTRSRFGRRSPWILGTALVGTAGSIVIALAPGMLVLILGWIVMNTGFGTMIAALGNTMADRLPETQRGKVAGLSGVAQMAASIIGVTVASVFVSSSVLMLLVPALVAVVAAVLFFLLAGDPDSRDLPAQEPISARLVFSKYVFDVRRHSDFAWNWLGRSSFNFGLTLATTFTTFFFAYKLGTPVDEIGGFVALVGAVSVVATMVGAGVSGFLSDRFRRRKSFVLAAAVVFAIGMAAQVLVPSIPLLIVAACVANFGLGVFSAVDQALVLDVLPERETDAGRFTAINAFSTTIPQALAPLLAPLVLAIGTTTGDNYTLLYFVAAAFALVGGLIILSRVKSVR